MAKTFYFIDGVQPDESSKKLMRRHVMKGKNAGKKVHRTSKLRVKKIDSHLIPIRNAIPPAAWGGRQVDTPVTRSCEKSLLAFEFSLPLHISPDSARIINECKTGSMFTTLGTSAHISTNRFCIYSGQNIPLSARCFVACGEAPLASDAF